MSFLRHPPPGPPGDVATLLERAQGLAGRSFADVADELGERVPPDLRRHKGWVGCLAELALGADAASRDEPDFRALGIELKTVPLDGRGKPLETTFVATVPLSEMGEVPWETSRVARKLRHVLWLPIEGVRAMPLAERRFGGALLWELGGEDEEDLRADWEEIAGIIGRGDVEAIDASIGRYLHVRPKAANSRVRRRSVDAEGLVFDANPRGFYLRTGFTARLLARHFALPR